MSRGERPDLPLFDLPLHGEIEKGGTDPAAVDAPSVDVDGVESGPAEPDLAEPGRPVEPEQSQLFDDTGFEEAPDEEGFDEALDGSGPDDEPLDEDAGVLDRLVGGVVDLLVHVIVLAGVTGASWLMGVRPSLDDWPAFAGFLLLFSLLYTGVPLAFWGQTPGMMRVGHVARTGAGEPLTFGQTALRWLGALLTLVLVGLPLLMALGASSRSLADRVSGSYTEQI